MCKIKELANNAKGKLYIYLADKEIGTRFLQDAENEGYTFCDGTKPTKRQPDYIMAVNDDMTINYVGFIGRVAYQASSGIDKIDYRKIISCSQ